MPSIKDFQDKFLRRDDPQFSGEVVASGLICPSCRQAFSGMDELLQHAEMCQNNSPSNEQQTSNGAPHFRGSSPPSNTSARPVQTLPPDHTHKLAGLSQEVVRWKAKCDEQHGDIDALRTQLAQKDSLLKTKLAYIDQLQTDLLKYEENNDDSSALKTELSSLQSLIASVTSESEREVNDLLDELHASEESTAKLRNEVSQRDTTINEFRKQLSDYKDEVDGLKSAIAENTSLSSVLQSTENVDDTNVADKGEECSDDLVENLRQKLKGQAEELLSERSAHEARVLCLQQDVERLQQSSDRGCAQCKDYEASLQADQRRHTDSQSTLKSEIASLKDQLGTAAEELQRSASALKSTEEGFASERLRIASLEQQITQLSSELETSKSNSELLQREIADLISQQDRKIDLQAKNEALQQQLHEKDTRVDELFQEVERQKAAVESGLAEYEALERSTFTSTNDLNLEMNRVKRAKDELEAQIDVLRGNIDSVRAELLDRETTHEEQLSLLNQNLSQLRVECSSQEEALEQARGVSESARAVNETLAESLARESEECQRMQASLASSREEFERVKAHYVEVRGSLDQAQTVVFELGREQQALQMERARMLDRNWLPDEDATHCPSCSKEFSATLRRHHCRSCGRIFCHDCSAKRAKLAAHPNPVRVCDSCIQMLPAAPATLT